MDERFADLLTVFMPHTRASCVACGGRELCSSSLHVERPFLVSKVSKPAFPQVRRLKALLTTRSAAGQQVSKSRQIRRKAGTDRPAGTPT